MIMLTRSSFPKGGGGGVSARNLAVFLGEAQDFVAPRSQKVSAGHGSCWFGWWLRSVRERAARKR